MFINNILKKYINIDELTELESDFKSRLIEWCQKNRHEIIYETNFHAVENGRQTFKSNLYIDSVLQSSEVGNSKKEAEQRASGKVYRIFCE
ncbi:MAG: putative dsRNA-binding protein [Rikenellaceae bacterium]|nr:putative dsRNA-binding protein [Rikenellaceae bacterium]